MIIDYIFLYICAGLLNINAIYSVIVAFVISAIFNFCVNRVYTFKKKDALFLPQILKYIISVGLSLSLTILIIDTLMINNINVYLAKLFALATVFILNFILSNRFIYK